MTEICDCEHIGEQYRWWSEMENQFSASAMFFMRYIDSNEMSVHL